MPQLRRGARHGLGLVIFAAVLFPIALEVAWRVGYSVQLGSTAWLTYPGPDTPLGQRQGATVAKGDPSGAPVLLPPAGPFEFRVENNLVSSFPIHAPGFRGRSIEASTPGRTRIAAVGGSTTFSPECGEHQSWPERLELRLRRTPSGPAVFNAGAFGASSAEVLWIVENLVLPHNIDFLLVSTAFNDVPAGHIQVDLRPLAAPWHRRHLWGRSLFYTALTQAYLTAQRTSGADFAAVQEAYADNLRAIVQAARARGTQPIFIAQPILEPHQISVQRSALGRRGSGTSARRVVDQLGNRVARQQVLVDRMQLEAAAADVPFIDIRASFVDVAEPQALFELFLHLSPAGAERFAQLLAPQLERVMPEGSR